MPVIRLAVVRDGRLPIGWDRQLRQSSDVGVVGGKVTEMVKSELANRVKAVLFEAHAAVAEEGRRDQGEGRRLLRA